MSKNTKTVKPATKKPAAKNNNIAEKKEILRKLGFKSQSEIIKELVSENGSNPLNKILGPKLSDLVQNPPEVIVSVDPANPAQSTLVNVPVDTTAIRLGRIEAKLDLIIKLLSEKV